MYFRIARIFSNFSIFFWRLDLFGFAGLTFFKVFFTTDVEGEIGGR